MKAVGDDVALGDELVEIETDKANMVYESDVAGTLIEILAEEGATLPIGEVIARSRVKPGTLPRGAGAERVRRRATRRGTGCRRGDPRPRLVPIPGDADGDPGERVKASPLARRMAREQGIDLVRPDRLRTGWADHQGRRRGAGRAAAARRTPQPPPSPPARERVETARGTAEAFELLAAAADDRPAHGGVEGDRSPLLPDIRDRHVPRGRGSRSRSRRASAEGEIVPSFNDMVVKACALALREFPRANGAYRDGAVEEYSRVNVGVAVAAQDALVVPTVFDADAKGLRQIADETRALAARVREGTITPPELSGGTFTVSNLGMFGVTSFSAVINPPQAAILAVGAIREVPVVRDGEVVAGNQMSVTLACDHRILYGADGARFLAKVRDLLEEPVFLAL